MECISNLYDLLDYVVREVNRDVAKQGNELIYLQWDISYTEHLPNTHYAPKGFKTCFSIDGIQYFKGWTGRINLAYAKEPKGFGSDSFRKLRIYTGSGGYGSYNGYKIPNARHYGYDFRIFLDDFPTIISGEAINPTGAFREGSQVYRYLKK